MNIEVQPLGNEYRFDSKQSDIVEVFSTLSGLRIVVATWLDSVNEVLLTTSTKILKGGWLCEEQSGLLDVTKALQAYREWFIATTNGCMTVLASAPPVLKDLKKDLRKE